MENNPANMSNEDLEKDAALRSAENHRKTGDETGAATEEITDQPEENTMDMGVDFVPEKEQDLDDLLHQQGDVKHTGTMPDSEELKFRESQ